VKVGGYRVDWLREAGGLRGCDSDRYKRQRREKQGKSVAAHCASQSKLSR
jgi:hypothetical protein